ncbi:hypothetical protein [Acidithiobacillus ferrooxidans]|jgi:hypothetical protein|uniref:hypothetical protein n=1 Tax=Acidithiobacillus ferrooxidans TaxID=920 RepID=UPI000A69A337|nr:hypothetical protein [Acidithiobacillus ferrooxidans]
MEGKHVISLLVVFVVLSIMAITMYLDYIDMFVWSAIHHHTATSQLKSGFLTFCLLMWNMSQLAWLPIFVKLFAKDEKLCKEVSK